MEVPVRPKLPGTFRLIRDDPKGSFQAGLDEQAGPLDEIWRIGGRASLSELMG